MTQQRQLQVTRATLATQLEHALRDEILSGVLQPGARLRAEEIATRYGVSPTPTREALQRLLADSLISLDPRTGIQVAQVSLEELRDVYRVRIVVEREALASAIARADGAWERNLTQATRRLAQTWERRTWPSREEARLARSAAHKAFDGALFGTCDSSWLLRFVTTLSAHSERYRMLLRSINLDRDLVGEHQAISEAALRRDVVAAQAAHETHLRTTLEVLEQHFSQETARG